VLPNEKQNDGMIGTSIVIIIPTTNHWILTLYDNSDESEEDEPSSEEEVAKPLKKTKSRGGNDTEASSTESMYSTTHFHFSMSYDVTDCMMILVDPGMLTIPELKDELTRRGIAFEPRARKSGSY
jgi:hypothetical protein